MVKNSLADVRTAHYFVAFVAGTSQKVSVNWRLFIGIVAIDGTISCRACKTPGYRHKDKFLLDGTEIHKTTLLVVGMDGNE